MNKKLIVIIVMLVSIYLLFCGCGKKGPPVPPRRENPPAIEDLSHRLDGNSLELSWSVPEKDNSRQPDLAGFKVYVSKIALSESECENCPLKFKAIADVPIRKKAEQKQLMYSETLGSGYQYVYMVRGYSEDGLISEDSNYINFTIE
jgi:predicted small lipoprotein YifL